MAPSKHALLSASSAERWMACSAAPRYEEQFPETTSPNAEHGRIAHEMCELKVLKKFTTSINQRTYTSRLNKLIKKEKEFVEAHNAQHPDKKLEISGDTYSSLYLEHLTEKAMSYDTAPSINAEVKVDLTEYIPGGFGTCDCVMIGGDTLDITDYKHGKGVPVSAVGNPQMRLYALGVLREEKPVIDEAAYLYPFIGDRIKNVRMTIDQPRIQDEPSSETLTVDELKAWGESIKPLALLAYSGFGEFKSGEHCRFCRGKVQCRARADSHTAFEDFKDCLLPTAANAAQVERDREGGKPASPILSHAEIGDLLARGKCLVAWYNDLEDFALKAVLNGEDIPGWKVVAGTSRRKITDQLAAITALTSAGYDEALLYKAREIVAFSELDKLVGGEKQLKALLGDVVQKPIGKPALAPLSDKRAPYNSAVTDFADAAARPGESKGVTP